MNRDLNEVKEQAMRGVGRPFQEGSARTRALMWVGMSLHI